MPGAFPAEAQAIARLADAPAADGNAMHLLQIVLQEASCPDRVAVARGPGVGVDDLGDQRIDNADGSIMPRAVGGRPSRGASCKRARRS